MYETPDPLPNAPQPPPDGPQRPRIWFIVVALIVVVSLLGSAIAGVVWLFAERERLAEAEPETVTVVVDVTATPAPTEAAAEIDPDLAEETAVPTLVEPTLNRIVFVNQNGQLVTSSPTGETQRQLTGGDGRYQFPAWSPDGNSLAAIATEGRRAAIYRFPDETEAALTELYASSSETPFYFYWSPDNETIAFLANHPRAPMALHLVGTDGSDDSRLVTTGGPFYWEWTAAGDQLFIHTGFAGDGARLTFIDTDGESSGDNIARPGFFQAPGISADGRFFSYAKEDGGASRIVIADAARDEKFAQPHQGGAALSWSPSGHLLAYISSGEPGGTGFIGPLRMMDAETGDVTLLSRDNVLSFFWSPDGRYIAYLKLTNEESDEINAGLPPAPWGASSPTTAKRVQQNNIPGFDLILIDVNTGEGRVLLTDFQPSILFIAQFLPFFDQYALSHRLWSPASDALVLPIVVDGENEITVIPVNGGSRRVIGNGTIAFWSQQ